MSKSYSEKLKNPKWQKKRLEVLSRDNFTCQACFDKESTLHVHHKTYIYGNDPWDYHDNNFITLCEHCHETEEFYKSEINGLIHDGLMAGISYADFFKHIEPLVRDKVLSHLPYNYQV